MQKITGADWEVDRSGLIDLKDPVSIKKGLTDVKEAIQINFYVLDHPAYGRFLIDTGIGDVFKKDKSEWPFTWIVKKGMGTDSLKIKTATGEWMSRNPGKINGVFFTHLHLDHIMGTNDISPDTPLYVGPKESTFKSVMNMMVQGNTDEFLKGKTIQELDFSEPNSEQGLSILDFFGDKSFLIFHSPGHTPGSLAFLIHSKDGLQLLLGDTCHSRFGWENNVPPGDFSDDKEQNKKSLTALQNIAKKFSVIKIHPGHQNLKE
ncbi:MAG TPA: MBL fold metallo-hydrolase [Leptospiraceae bacterium]|nr:MBL fold metallo-hydrolase [Leptospiraceae bacterium]HMY67309.1 MBL fold metallo-hydrolase [Leptospiraceae bacterium]HMZ59027.1 MBL fold metallo-hydrolase [Leptospiraceae bacterium]HNF12231.1 MBL fold metallo-hydrolase [Leptospiraceae bacterium]HNF23272.1 MBL fold metallo-hydrolase [Leptospiraceae bacterium]